MRSLSENSLHERHAVHTGMLMLTAAVITSLLVLAPSVGRAQGTTDDGPSRVASINPFIVLFGYFSGEYEQRLSRTLSLGIAGSSITFGDDDRRNNLDVKARLYPNERALNGFGLGASVGYSHMHKKDYVYPDFGQCSVNIPGSCDPTEEWKNYSAPSVAIEISYQWLLGSRKSTAVVVGGGAKRAFTTKEKWGSERITPTGRLSVGYAF